MGKATRWLRGVLGMKKDKENTENNSNCGDKRDKKRWGFAKSGKDSGGLSQIPANIQATAAESAWLRSYIDDTNKDQNKHAIAVAAATAAAADAAVTAAQAAVAVVRLTSKGRGALYNGGRERWAAIKIQSLFRGYLARKALRALKGLVKLQAHVRGFLVRKQAVATLYSMQALIRAQASIRSQRARRSMTNEYRFQPETRARKSIERFDETRSEFHSKRLSASYDYHSINAFEESPKIVEIDTCCPKARPEFQVPTRLSIPSRHRPQDCDWGYIEEDYKFPTAQSTPRFACSGRAHAPTTPTKSVCGDSFFIPYPNYPSYMANTQSFRAKLRSHSAPKQRPEAGPKKRLSLNEIMASRTSFSGVRMQKYSQVQEDHTY